jgi:hypothetical protein
LTRFELRAALLALDFNLREPPDYRLVRHHAGARTVLPVRDAVDVNFGQEQDAALWAGDLFRQVRQESLPVKVAMVTRRGKVANISVKDVAVEVVNHQTSRL